MSFVFWRSFRYLSTCSVSVGVYSAETALVIWRALRWSLAKLRISGIFLLKAGSCLSISVYHLYSSSPRSFLKWSLLRLPLNRRLGTSVLASLSAAFSSIVGSAMFAVLMR
jgi:hypothetical protein